MKLTFTAIAVILTNLLCLNVHAATQTHVLIQDQKAKVIFEAMTDVQEEGAAGHSYKKGKNILCWRVNADIDDSIGHLIPPDDSRRFKCSFNVDAKGVVTPDNRF